MDDTSSTHLQCSLLCTHKHQADWRPIIGLSSPSSMECKKFELTSSDRIQPHMVGIQYSLADLLKILCHKVHRQWRNFVPGCNQGNIANNDESCHLHPQTLPKSDQQHKADNLTPERIDTTSCCGKGERLPLSITNVISLYRCLNIINFCI